jgi:signal transduction histidine kinase
MFGFMIDISEQKHAEEELIELGGRLIVAQEKERSRIARELHDDFNQRLALLSIELEQLGQTVHEPVNHQLLQKLQRDAKELSADVHRLSYSLHPSKLDHLGLVAAVKSLCEEISESSKIKVEFKHDGLLATLPKDVTLCFFRITQESLRNSVKHSGAEAVRVLLVRTRNAVRLSVSDNGCGFDTKSEKMRAGLGFISMRERLHVVGGELHIYSRPRRGTRIEASVPLRPDFKQGNSLESVLVKT